MELTLNLFWLMLALPAYWLWRREAEPVYRSGRFDSLRCLLVLGCILMLLFPVVSATDDLHFMRPEMEESSPSKRTLKHAGSDNASNSLKVAVTAAAEATDVAAFAPAGYVCGLVFISTLSSFFAVRLLPYAKRAPPSSLFA